MNAPSNGPFFVRLLRTGQRLRLDPGSPDVMRGGEAAVYPFERDPSRVVKVYHKVGGQEAKLRYMVRTPPTEPMSEEGHVSFAWPADLVIAEANRSRVVGYVMPRISGRTYEPHEVYSPSGRRRSVPFVTHHFLHAVAMNFCQAMWAVHEKGYVVGDVNQRNLRIHANSLISLIDCDSFQVREGQGGRLHRCTVGVPEFTPPELQRLRFDQVDRTPNHDCFGLAVLVFHLLMEGYHPFQCMRPPHVGSETLQDHIRQGYYAHGGRLPRGYGPPPKAPSLSMLAPKIGDLFRRAFTNGGNPRPSAREWAQELETAMDQLVQCPINDHHVYHPHQPSCPWCDRHGLLGIDPFPSREAIQRGEHLRPGPKAGRQRALAPAWGSGVPVAPHPRPPRPAAASPAARTAQTRGGPPAPAVRAPSPRPRSVAAARTPRAATPGSAAAAPPVAIAGPPFRWRQAMIGGVELPLYLLVGFVCWGSVGWGIGFLSATLQGWRNPEIGAVQGVLIASIPGLFATLRAWWSSWEAVRGWGFSTRGHQIRARAPGWIRGSRPIRLSAPRYVAALAARAMAEVLLSSRQLLHDVVLMGTVGLARLFLGLVRIVVRVGLYVAVGALAGGVLGLGVGFVLVGLGKMFGAQLAWIAGASPYATFGAMLGAAGGLLGGLAVTVRRA